MNLLRGRVKRRADERAGAGQLRVGDQRAGQAEVADLDSTVGFQEAVGWFDVAVHQAEAVRFLQTLDHVQNLAHGLFCRKRPALAHQVVERRARHQLHDDVGPPRFLVSGQHKDAARMSERAGQPAFLAEARQRLRGTGVLGQNELEGNPPAGGRFLRQPITADRLRHGRPERAERRR